MHSIFVVDVIIISSVLPIPDISSGKNSGEWTLPACHTLKRKIIMGEEGNVGRVLMDAMIKDFVLKESRLTREEKNDQPSLARAESILECVNEQARTLYTTFCNRIEKVRAAQKLSATAVDRFAEDANSSILVYETIYAFIQELSGELLTEQDAEGKVMTRMFKANSEAFQNALRTFTRHIRAHISTKSQNGTGVQFQASHMLRLRRLLDEVSSAVSLAIAPLSLSFSRKLKRVVDKRESFLIAQMSKVVEKRQRIIELHGQVQDIRRRRARLETGASNLDRMFEVLTMVQTSSDTQSEGECEDDNAEVDPRWHLSIDVLQLNL